MMHVMEGLIAVGIGLCVFALGALTIGVSAMIAGIRKLF